MTCENCGHEHAKDIGGYYDCARYRSADLAQALRLVKRARYVGD